MADQASGKAYLPSLPLELLDVILSELENLELKALRQTSKFLNKLSTPRLFGRFVIYPHVRSFERLISISKSDSIRHHVHWLQYEIAFLGITTWFHKHIGAVWSKDVSLEDKKQLAEHARQLDMQSIQSKDPMDNLAQLHYLEEAFSGMTNLKRVDLFDLSVRGWKGTFDRHDIPHFYKQMEEETCGRYPHTKLPRGPLGLIHSSSKTYAHALLVALSRLPCLLEELGLYGVGWPNLLLHGDLCKQQQLFQKHLANLKSLHFGVGNNSYFPPFIGNGETTKSSASYCQPGRVQSGREAPCGY